MPVQKYILFITLLFCCLWLAAQSNAGTRIIIVINTEKQQPASGATVELLRASDSAVLQSLTADSAGTLKLSNLPPGNYVCRISYAGHLTQYIQVSNSSTGQEEPQSLFVTLKTAGQTLANVNITAHKPPVQQLPDRIVIQVDAGITNAGSTVLDVLEKSPGIMVDRAGGIALKGRTGVLILIDGKQVYVTGNDLITLLGTMNAAQVDVIEIMDNPPAKYDAAGNAGIINIKTKKNQQKGFNGTVNVTYGQGRYYKNNNSLALNYRNNRWNYFLNYSLTANKNFMKLYALRTYYKPDNTTVDALLEQPTWLSGKGYNHTVRTGADYALSPRTTIGISLLGSLLGRDNPGSATAAWKTPSGTTDSVIVTESNNGSHWRNGGINLNVKHDFGASQMLTADLDYLGYDIANNQFFRNTMAGPGGYENALKGDLDAAIRIFTAKADYSQSLSERYRLEAGWKSSNIRTNNLAEYFNLLNTAWQPDLGKTNHFIYDETIHALYGNLNKTQGAVTAQLGLRYEYTYYKANQLGNTVIKDSSFTRRYNSLFPTAFITWQADSSSSFTFTAGRRIERPAFQKLNPFVFVINKYTYQQGNPFFRPQYTWNLGVSHSFKNKLTTSLDYSIARDYFSQIFLSDSTGTMIYTEGNVGRMQNLALSVSLQTPVTAWWYISADVTLSHKQMNAVLWKNYRASFTQMNTNVTNQFRLGKGWLAELTGTYTSRSQQDLQEVLLPTGMLNVGVSKQVLKNKGTLKLSCRDVLYTQVMAGNTDFELADEYFKIQRDTRVVSLSFSYRFGKSFKPGPVKTGGADDEMQRAGGS